MLVSKKPFRQSHHSVDALRSKVIFGAAPGLHVFLAERFPTEIKPEPRLLVPCSVCRKHRRHTEETCS